MTARKVALRSLPDGLGMTSFPGRSVTHLSTIEVYNSRVLCGVGGIVDIPHDNIFFEDGGARLICGRCAKVATERGLTLDLAQPGDKIAKY